jgi:hypothetical protein
MVEEEGLGDPPRRMGVEVEVAATTTSRRRHRHGQSLMVAKHLDL